MGWLELESGGIVNAWVCQVLGRQARWGLDWKGKWNFPQYAGALVDKAVLEEWACHKHRLSLKHLTLRWTESYLKLCPFGVNSVLGWSPAINLSLYLRDRRKARLLWRMQGRDNIDFNFFYPLIHKYLESKRERKTCNEARKLFRC